MVAIFTLLKGPFIYFTNTEQIELENVLLFFTASLILSSVPFSIGLVIKDKVFKSLLWNTVDIEYESVEVTEDSIIHTWHQKGAQPEEMLEYKIHHDYVESAHLDKTSKMLTIVGSATITPYENYAAKLVDRKYPAYTTSYKNIEQFFIALDDTRYEDEILTLIKGVAEERYSES